MTLFSQSWYKVANLKVRLRKHAIIHRHVYRDKIWFVLQDHITGQFQRFTPEAYQIIGLMDGSRTLEQIWQIACEQLGDDLPTQDEVIQLVGQLNKANVIQTDGLPNIAQLQTRRQSEERKKWLQQIKSPLSIRIPLLDPEHFLEKTEEVAKFIFSRMGALLWLLTVVLGSVLAILNWSELTNNLSDQVLGLENLLLMALVYPVVKLIHELGHGYAVKRWGGEVHEMGIMLLIFIPVPYVEASSASSFRNKYQRMLVGAVGVLGELWMAALAMIVWSLAEPGIVRAVAYNVMLIGGISTVLFNGNPLLRFDAYYVLADYLEIPNLASRGNAQVGYLVKRYLFRISEVRTNAHSRSESVWLASYAVAAYLYRLFVMVAISLFVATKYLFIGVLLAMWSIWTSLILPTIHVISSPFKDALMQRKKIRIYSISAIFIAGVVTLLLVVPAPYKTYAQGVLYVPQQSFIRAKTNGFIDEVLEEEGEFVTADQSLIRMHAPDTQTRLEVVKGQVREARVRYESAINDRSESDILYQELKFLEQEQQTLQQQLDSLDIVSNTNGVFVLPFRHGTKGRFYPRGEVIGYVVDYKDLPLSVMISEDDIDRVRLNTKSLSFKLVSDLNNEYQGKILRQMPSSTKMLPSAILSTEGGGQIALNPDRRQALESYQSHFRIEVSSDSAPKLRFDERVHVLFEHEAEPIAYRWYRTIRRVFLRQFDV